MSCADGTVFKELDEEFGRMHANPQVGKRGRGASVLDLTIADGLEEFE